MSMRRGQALADLAENASQGSGRRRVGNEGGITQEFEVFGCTTRPSGWTEKRRSTSVREGTTDELSKGGVEMLSSKSFFSQFSD